MNLFSSIAVMGLVASWPGWAAPVPARPAGQVRPKALSYRQLVDPARKVEGSLSLGTTASGQLLRGAVLPHQGQHHDVLATCRNRATNFGTDELVRLIQNASAQVALKHPGSRLTVCNLSVKGGGPLKWSRSHHAGRDVDLTFYVRLRGKPVPSPGFLSFGARLAAAGRPGYRFDPARNWELVKALVTHPTVRVQWIFLAAWLKKAVLDQARKAGERRELLVRAARVMHQPTYGQPHDDHMHVRIYCSLQDRLEGCLDFGPVHPGVDTGRNEVAARIRALLPGLADKDASVRLSVLRFLIRLDARTHAPAIARRALADASPDMRHAALAALGSWGSRHPAVIAELAAFIRRPGGGISQNDPAFELQGTQVEDPRRTVRQLRLAYRALGEIATWRSIGLLVSALRSRRIVGPGRAPGSAPGSAPKAAPGSVSGSAPQPASGSAPRSASRPTPGSAPRPAPVPRPAPGSAPRPAPVPRAGLAANAVHKPTIGPKGGVPEAFLAARAARNIMDKRLVLPLIRALEHRDGQVRTAAAVALRRITNHSFRIRWARSMGPTQRARARRLWERWWKPRRTHSRKRLVMAGFRRVRRRLFRLRGRKTVLRLIAFTQRPDHIGYNANRLLRQITGEWAPREPRSTLALHRRWMQWWKMRGAARYPAPRRRFRRRPHPRAAGPPAARRIRSFRSVRTPRGRR